MKLYTEQEVRKLLNEILMLSSSVEDAINSLSPIELPSDDEIEERIGFEYPATHQNAFKEGAKWMRDKILGGKK